MLVRVVVMAMAMKEGKCQLWISRLRCLLVAGLLGFIGKGMGELWLVVRWKEKKEPTVSAPGSVAPTHSS